MEKIIKIKVPVGVDESQITSVRIKKPGSSAEEEIPFEVLGLEEEAPEKKQRKLPLPPTSLIQISGLEGGIIRPPNRISEFIKQSLLFVGKTLSKDSLKTKIITGNRFYMINKQFEHSAATFDLEFLKTVFLHIFHKELYF